LPSRLPQHILLVDDEPATRYLVSSVLQNEGFEVAMAIDGAEAVRLVATQRPALVLLDWRLPGRNGGQVAQAIRSHHPDAKFVIITADGRAADKAEQVATSWYLKKPFQIDDLIRVVRSAIAA